MKRVHILYLSTGTFKINLQNLSNPASMAMKKKMAKLDDDYRLTLRVSGIKVC